MDDNLCPEDVNGDTDFLVLDPPPGFEDIPFHLYQDHFYDDPYCGDDELDLTPELDSKTVSHFAEDMACSLLSDVVKPKVRMRLKKSFSTSPTPCCDTFSCTQGDIYSVPIDSLTSNKGREKGLSRQSSRNSGQSCARHSIAATQPDSGEPVHMTLEEVRCYLREFQSSSRNTRPHPWVIVPSKSVDSDSKRKSCFVWTPMSVSSKSFDEDRNKRSRKSLSVTAAGIKQALFSVFRIPSHLHHHHQQSASNNQICQTGWTFSMPDRSDVPNSARSSPKQRRALPPIPNEAIGFVRMPRSTPRTSIGTEMQQLDLSSDSPSVNLEPPSPQPPVDLADGKLDSSASASNLDFAASIDQVKNHGWYWGPLSGEAAEKILFSEPDGSFLVRDSSDDHYIFSLSFKLNGGVRHVRIEHDHGTSIFDPGFSIFPLNYCRCIRRQLQLWQLDAVPESDDGRIH